MSAELRLAVSMPIPPDREACLETGVWAERQGFDGLWLADIGSLDAITLAAALACRTRTVRIGLGVVPAYTRTPALLAASVTTLSQLAPGRIVMGLGASSHAMIEGWHGMAFEKPLTRVKETAITLRRMLAGEQVAFEGETLRTAGFRMSPPLKGDVPIYIAALRPNMLEMAGEVGDGVVINMQPLSAMPRMLEHIAKGAARAGKRLSDLEIVCRHSVCVTDDPAAARKDFRKRFAPYFATPVYNKFLAWCGFPEVAATIAEGWREKNREKTAGAFSDELIDQLAIIGDAEKCRADIRAFVKAGVTTPVINPVNATGGEVRETLEAFVPANFSR